jgi:hypothetical protein
LLLLSASSESAEKKPIFLYSRYFNAVGENRYLPDGTYKDVLRRLSAHFEVRVSSEPLNAQTLKEVDVVLVANPSDQSVAGGPAPHHVSAQDISDITEFVENGGGFIVMGNQENHNLETRDMNKLLKHFGMQFTNVYTDAKKLLLPANTPLIAGLRWAYYTGNQLLLDPTDPAQPRALVENDLKQKPAKGERDTPGVLLAISTPGKGHVVAVTDAGWITDDALSEKGIGGVALKDQDNWKILQRLAGWAASRPGRE